MKLFLLLALVALSDFLFAQSSLQFTIKQLPELIVDAGKDTTVNKGTQLKIGGVVPAKGGSGVYIYSWAPSFGLDRSDIANPLATVDTSITYTLSVNDGKGCIKSSSITIRLDTVTAINPIVTELGLKIYPNPTSGILFITTEKILSEKLMTVKVYDVNGRLVNTQEIQGYQRINQKIQLLGLARGLYILKLSSNRVNLIYKIVIQ